MKYFIIAVVLMILSIFCQASSLLASQPTSSNFEIFEELDNVLDDEENPDEDTIGELDELNELNELNELEQNTEVEFHEDAEETEEIIIVKFNVEGLMLREGIISEEVLRLKKFFIVKGYEGLNESYYFDKRTKEVVIDYQSKNGLIPDGIVGKNTFTKINEDMEINKIVIPKLDLIFIIDSLIPEGNFIVINKDNNTLYHLNNKQLIKRYPVATGKDIKYTPEGKFTVVNKVINPYWGGAGISKPIKGGDPRNPLGSRWMGLSIGGGRKYGIHGNSDKSSIGKYISLGCIRMFNDDVEELFDLISVGTPIWIGTENTLKELGIVFGYNMVTNVDSEVQHIVK